MNESHLESKNNEAEAGVYTRRNADQGVSNSNRQSRFMSTNSLLIK